MVVDLAVVGEGISGTSVKMVASQYCEGLNIVSYERQRAVAEVNSNPDNNSNTLHFGDIEDNYGLEAALRVQEQAAFTAGYLARNHADNDGTCIMLQRMLLGVGEAQVSRVKWRYETFRGKFPGIQLLDAAGIAAVEPNVMAGRKAGQPVAALYHPRGFAVDYRMLAQSFVRQAALGSANIEAQLNVEIISITKRPDGIFVLKTAGDEVAAKAVVVAAGSSSLMFAHAMGLGREYILLPVAGGFMLSSRHILNGKVYTPQNEKIPFAALHGDPAVYNRLQTRFGPTAKPVFLLERHHYNTVREFMRTGGLSTRWFWHATKVAMDRDVGSFLLRNRLYDIPFFGKKLFTSDIRKIVPTIESKDLRLDKGAGGIRGQLVNTKTGKMQKGVARIDQPGISFVFAPSPGASGALGNAVEVMRNLAPVIGKRFDEDRIRRELLGAARDIGAIGGVA